MQTYFNTLKEAREHIKKSHESKTSFNRKEASEVLGISTATLHRKRGQGLITATETEVNNIVHISYKLDDIARLLLRIGVKL